MTEYNQINTLEEIVFVGGTVYTIEFTVYDDTGAPVDLSTMTCEWAMSYYGQEGSAVYSADFTSTIVVNVFTATIPSSVTESLSGKFVHQPIITDFGGDEFRPAQGVITIIPAIII